MTEQKVSVYLRRDLITFEIAGPDGEKTTCEPIDAMRHPARRGFTNVAAHRSIVLTARLVELCPRWTFAKSGEYLVRASYDPRVSGKTVGVDAFTGELEADRSVSVWVRHGLHVIRNHFVSRDSAGHAPTKTAAPPPPAPPPSRRLPVRR
ncbi:MAG TPA: hypothetical protein VH062_15000 [Polyangiaceae bacterium]|nr:hypothetical protein [Polyangiaceae bacterium]